MLEVPSHALHKGTELDGAFIQGMYQVLQGLDRRVTGGHCIAPQEKGLGQHSDGGTRRKTHTQ